MTHPAGRTIALTFCRFAANPFVKPYPGCICEALLKWFLRWSRPEAGVSVSFWTFAHFMRTPVFESTDQKRT